MRDFTITLQHCVNGTEIVESMQAESIADAVVDAALRWPHAAKIHIVATPLPRLPQPGCFAKSAYQPAAFQVQP
ncbi:MAG: hypothetical protein KA751_00725 [Comamonas sp.]|nr:hypothetical protein [Comamonas sp.]